MDDLYPESRTATEWRCLWFPPDAPHRIFHGTEEQVRRKAENVSEWNPLVERRDVHFETWEDGE